MFNWQFHELLFSQFNSPKSVTVTDVTEANQSQGQAGADWTVGKSVIYRIKFTKKKKKKKKMKKKKKRKKINKRKNIKKKIHRERPKQIDQKGPLVYALNLTEKGLQIFMRRI